MVCKTMLKSYRGVKEKQWGKEIEGFRRAPKIDGYVYTAEEAIKARDKGELLSIRVENSLACDLACTYCCNRSGKALSNEISLSKILGVIEQAKGLGARSVVDIGGGEPTIYHGFKDIIEKIDFLGMIPVIFTNTQTITPEKARFLRKHNTSVITKLDSLDETIQDAMTPRRGAEKRGAYRKIMEGIRNLQDAGYTDTDDSCLKLGASFVVNRQNANGIPDVWRFCRDNKMFPNLEMMVPNGEAKDCQELLLNRDEWRDLKLQLLEIDRKEYGYDWLPYTPLLASGCLQPLYNLYITTKGLVRPCSSIHVEDEKANIYYKSLKEILGLPFFQLARNIDKHLEGKCSECEHVPECIGCRGLSYATGKNAGEDPFTALCREDPSCFKEENYS